MVAEGGGEAAAAVADARPASRHAHRFPARSEGPHLNFFQRPLCQTPFGNAGQGI